MAPDRETAASQEADSGLSFGKPTVEIEVAYALPERQLLVSLKVPAGTTVAQAIEASGIRAEFPQIETHPVVGIFSRKVALDSVLQAGDRVEIYRPLAVDPKEMRRRKAEKEKPGRKIST